MLAAPRADDPALRAQRAALAGHADGLKDRDMVVLEVIADHLVAGAAGLDAALVRRAAALAADRFGVALIGKDGHVARRGAAPITAEALFGAIDAMPMRKDELRRR